MLNKSPNNVKALKSEKALTTKTNLLKSLSIFTKKQNDFKLPTFYKHVQKPFLPNLKFSKIECENFVNANFQISKIDKERKDVYSDRSAKLKFFRELQNFSKFGDFPELEKVKIPENMKILAKFKNYANSIFFKATKKFSDLVENFSSKNVEKTKKYCRFWADFCLNFMQNCLKIIYCLNSMVQNLENDDIERFLKNASEFLFFRNLLIFELPNRFFILTIF
ncbi:hypothetical protein MHBO_005279 [Bonamia ostreae]|uniref:Uncharacterized protein n=1 Tax=Bonamia ostreae TaxID=126728 RepID=A0ABV2AMU9_9EUKA